MRVLVVGNFRHTPLGQVETALREAGAAVDRRRAHRGEVVPDDHSRHDALVIHGALSDAAGLAVARAWVATIG